MKKTLLINKVINTQLPSGSWGYFHTLAKASLNNLTTEQALRILHENNYSVEDNVIQKAVKYLEGCLEGNIQAPDCREKAVNWDYFEKMMFATWIKIFMPNHDNANIIAKFWADIIKKSILDQKIDESKYECEYRKRIPKMHKGERLIGISQFYMASLLVGNLDQNTEEAFIEYILNNPTGIYYIYNKKIAEVPISDNSTIINRYFVAIKLLSKYPCAKEKLAFVNKWCKDNYSALANNKEISKENFNYILDFL